MNSKQNGTSALLLTISSVTTHSRLSAGHLTAGVQGGPAVVAAELVASGIASYSRSVIVPVLYSATSEVCFTLYKGNTPIGVGTTSFNTHDIDVEIRDGKKVFMTVNVSIEPHTSTIPPLQALPIRPPAPPAVSVLVISETPFPAPELVSSMRLNVGHIYSSLELHDVAPAFAAQATVARPASGRVLLSIVTQNGTRSLVLGSTDDLTYPHVYDLPDTAVCAWCGRRPRRGGQGMRIVLSAPGDGVAVGVKDLNVPNETAAFVTAARWVPAPQVGVVAALLAASAVSGSPTAPAPVLAPDGSAGDVFGPHAPFEPSTGVDDWASAFASAAEAGLNTIKTARSAVLEARERLASAEDAQLNPRELSRAKSARAKTAAQALKAAPENRLTDDERCDFRTIATPGEFSKLVAAELYGACVTIMARRTRALLPLTLPGGVGAVQGVPGAGDALLLTVHRFGIPLASVPFAAGLVDACALAHACDSDGRVTTSVACPVLRTSGTPLSSPSPAPLAVIVQVVFGGNTADLLTQEAIQPQPPQLVSVPSNPPSEGDLSPAPLPTEVEDLPAPPPLSPGEPTPIPQSPEPAPMPPPPPPAPAPAPAPAPVPVPAISTEPDYASLYASAQATIDALTMQLGAAQRRLYAQDTRADDVLRVVCEAALNAGFRSSDGAGIDALDVSAIAQDDTMLDVAGRQVAATVPTDALARGLVVLAGAHAQALVLCEELGQETEAARRETEGAQAEAARCRQEMVRQEEIISNLENHLARMSSQWQMERTERSMMPLQTLPSPLPLQPPPPPPPQSQSNEASQRVRELEEKLERANRERERRLEDEIASLRSELSSTRHPIAPLPAVSLTRSLRPAPVLTTPFGAFSPAQPEQQNAARVNQIMQQISDIRSRLGVVQGAPMMDHGMEMSMPRRAVLPPI